MSRPRPSLPRAAWLALGATAGATGAEVGLSPWHTLGTGLVLVAVALGAGLTGHGGRPARRRELPRALLAAGIGVLLIGLRIVAGPSPGVSPGLPAASGGPWVAAVEAMGSPRNGSQVARLRLSVESGTIVVAATLPAYPELAAGMLVEVAGRLQPPPDDDPYGDYLRRSGAAGTLSARSVRVIEPPASASLVALRDGAGDALGMALPEPEAGLAAGILVGLRERVDRDLAADFATTGVSHVVAISGWNIAIVAGIVGALLRGRRRRLVAIAVGGTILAYVLAAGASPSVVRAAVMASVVLVARESGRAGRAPAALAWAVVILLGVSPEMIADAGFRLSVLATAGLLAWATPLGAWIGRLGGGRIPAWLAESLGISLAAQAATLPDVLATFGRLSLVAPAVNLLVVPLVPVAMAGGVLALGGGTVAMLGAPAWVATLAGLPGWLLLHAMVVIVRVGASVPYAAVELPEGVGVPAGLCVAAAIAVLVLWLRSRRAGRQRPTRPGGRTPTRPGRTRGTSKRRNLPRLPALPSARGARTAAIALLIVACIGATAVADAATRETRLVVLDVGQGDAILLESRDGARMLVDGGPDPGRLQVELDEWIPPWDRRLDLLVLTHPHEDHVAGLVRVLERYAVGRVVEPGMRGPGPAWAAWDAALADGPPRGTLAAGDRIALAEFAFRVVWPVRATVPLEPPDSGTAINDVSVVLLGMANGRTFLLTGDAEEGVDPALLAAGLPRLDVLKVAHHGSATATTAELLGEARPSIAVISVGADNLYGHPAPSTLARLRDVGARVYRTDRDGTIEADLRADGVVVHTGGGRGRTAAAAVLGYDRADDPRPSPRGSPPAPRARAARLVPAAFVCRRRHRRLARVPAGRRRAVDRSGSRGGGRAAPRRRQAAVGRGARPPPARRGIGSLARVPGLGRCR